MCRSLWAEDGLKIRLNCSSASRRSFDWTRRILVVCHTWQKVDKLNRHKKDEMVFGIILKTHVHGKWVICTTFSPLPFPGAGRILKQAKFQSIYLTRRFALVCIFVIFFLIQGLFFFFICGSGSMQCCAISTDSDLV